MGLGHWGEKGATWPGAPAGPPGSQPQQLGWNFNLREVGAFRGHGQGQGTPMRPCKAEQEPQERSRRGEVPVCAFAWSSRGTLSTQ